jgi:hypothetical protein
MLARLILVLLALPAVALCAPLGVSSVEPTPSAEPTPEPRLAPKLLTPDELLAGLFDVLPPRPEANKTALLPIGFSEGGAFAFISHAWYSEMDGLSWSFVVQDLVTDTVLAKLPGVETLPAQSLEEAIAANRPAIVAALKKHGINARSRLHAVPAGTDTTGRTWDPKNNPQLPPDTPLLRPFPLFVGSTACAVVTTAEPDDQFALSVRCENRTKPLGSVWSPTAAPVAIGALISPWESRAAVVVQTAMWALHGSDPMHLHVRIFGTHLTEGFPPPVYSSP